MSVRKQSGTQFIAFWRYCFVRSIDLGLLTAEMDLNDDNKANVHNWSIRDEAREPNSDIYERSQLHEQWPRLKGFQHASILPPLRTSIAYEAAIRYLLCTRESVQ